MQGMEDIISAHVLVDPGGELADPGVDPGQIWSAAAGTPADDANEEPATPSGCPTGQGTARIPLTCKQSRRLSATWSSTRVPACGRTVPNSPCRRLAPPRRRRRTACVEKRGRSSSDTRFGSRGTPLLSAALKAALYLEDIGVCQRRSSGAEASPRPGC